MGVTYILTSFLGPSYCFHKREIKIVERHFNKKFAEIDPKELEKFIYKNKELLK